jgi:glycosyltransferase 2 family protein
MRDRTRSVVRGAAWVIGIGLVGIAIQRTGVGALRTELAQVGCKILWLFLAYAAGTAVAAVPWRLLLPTEARPGWGATLMGRFAAAGISVLFPFLGVGEGARLIWLRSSDRPTGIAALIVDRLLFSVAGAFILGAAVVAALRLPELPRGYYIGGALSALAMVLVAVAIAAAAARGQLVNGLVGRLVERLRRALRKTAASEEASPTTIAAADDALRAVLGGSKRPLVAGLALHVAARVLLAAEIYAGLWVLGADTTMMETLIFAAVPIALSVIGVVIPGQIGLQETVQMLVSQALGVSPTIGLALVLLQRARQLAFITLSLTLVALGRTPRQASRHVS